MCALYKEGIHHLTCVTASNDFVRGWNICLTWHLLSSSDEESTSGQVSGESEVAIDPSVTESEEKGSKSEIAESGRQDPGTMVTELADDEKVGEASDVQPSDFQQVRLLNSVL